MLRIGIDVGGTFTDVVIADDETGDVTVDKIPTTYPFPDEGVVAGLRNATQSLALKNRKVRSISHGTTIGTNALIERRGVDTAVVTTKGFKDVLELRRGKKATVWEFNFKVAPPLAPRRLRMEVTERIDHHGKVVTELDESSVDDLCRALVAAGVEAVAICLLFSYINPAHEKTVLAAIGAALPRAFVTASHLVDPHPLEFERTSTTVTNAYLGPLVGQYLGRLRSSVTALGLPEPLIMQSNGGLAQIQTVQDLPVLLVGSGPSAAVVAAQHWARLAGKNKVIMCDMGGTSFDVSIIVDGRARILRDRIINDYPVRAVMLDTQSIGAGGGSIASVDRGGSLKVGPESARSVPGPVCYGRGGTLPTVTDADLVLGHFPGRTIMGGAMTLDRDAAEAAIMREIARPLGMSVTEAAAGILRIVDAKMADATRVEVYGRGLDPRDFVLVVGGGAGPLHGSRIARELGITQLLIPPHPGTMSAFGAAITDQRHEATATLNLPFVPTTLAGISESLQELRDRVTKVFLREGVAAEEIRFEDVLDLRYVSERSYLPVQVDLSPGNDWMPAAIGAFESAHTAVYSFSSPDQDIVVVNAQVTGIVSSPFQTPRPYVEQAPVDGGPKASALKRTSHDVYFPEQRGWRSTPVLERADISEGMVLTGPCLIPEPDSMTLVLPGQEATALQGGSLLVTEAN
jgi:N-methylhydantoinase A